MYLGLTDLTSSAKCFLYSQNLCSCMCLGIPCTRRPWECVRERCVAMTDAQHASLQGTLLDTRNLVLSHVAVPFPSQGHLLTLHLLAFFYIPEVVQDTPSQLPTLAFCILSHLKEWLCSHNQDV